MSDRETSPGDTTRDGPAVATAHGLARGASVGRYIVLGHVGAGGMGVVYAAYDPDLDRKVALKLWRSAPAQGFARLLREAQAMARLSHPNVVAVHDVGLLAADELFIAMELVDGVTLRAWLAERRRGWREIVAAFRQAGAALAAAHALGIVHRDFKPENVLVDAVGRVRVADFGLARSAGAAGGDAASLDGSPLDAAVTRDGAIVGTPAYMAPEQRRGAIDARSDQYAFGVALYEALTGARPAAGSAPRRVPGVPGFVARVVARSLRERPEERFASMGALLAKLGDDPGVRARRWLTVAAPLAALAVAWGASALVVPRGDDRCAAAAEPYAAAFAPARRAALRAAFTATGTPYAADALRAVEPGLAGYAEELGAAAGASCRATRDGAQSPELAELRLACLDERRTMLDALAGVLATADAKVVQRAVEAVAALPRVADCGDVARLREPRPLPADGRARARVLAIRAAVAEARAYEAAGRPVPALARARALLPEAAALGHRPTEAEALYAVGLLLHATQDWKAAATTLERAVLVADAGNHRAIGAAAATLLVRIVGYQLAQRDAGLAWAARARALIEGLGDDPRLLSALENHLGVIDWAAQRWDDALAHHRRALELREHGDGPGSVPVAASLTNIGLVHWSRGEHAEAAAFHGRAVAIIERALGASHPRLADYLDNHAAALLELARYDEALVLYRRSLAIKEASYAPDALPLAASLTGMGNIEFRRGHNAESLALHRRALAIKEKALGPEHRSTLASMGNVAKALASLGRTAEARPLAEHVLAAQEKLQGPDHGDVAHALMAVAAIDRGERRHAAALPRLRRARDIWLAMGDQVFAATAIASEGEVLLESGDAAAALAPLERALALREAQATDPVQLAVTRFELAQALWITGRDKARARALAERARETPVEADRKQVEAWLAARRR